ncbi:phosphatase PAP2 family protein [Massilia sp. TN1-12]|uniref:phosphatase PAP2 family protein n=1 Tax=Massilia paldalensis TaxID=3377675 RepID=UPI00384E9945
MQATIYLPPLFHLGDLGLTLPAAGAIAAWLCAARAWRAAAGWLLVFGLAIAVVAASKIAFLGWATGWPALQFKAVSGHATGFTAAFPTLCWLLAGRCAAGVRAAVALAALALAAGVAAALVRAGEHTRAEAAAGWLIGAAVFACALRLTAAVPPAPPRTVGTGATAALLAFGLLAWVVEHAPLNRWMIAVALALSGNAAPYPWDHCG